jgi:hypothetical protein
VQRTVQSVSLEVPPCNVPTKAAYTYLPGHNAQSQQQGQAPREGTQQEARPEAKDAAERDLLHGRGVEGAAVFRKGCFGVAGVGVRGRRGGGVGRGIVFCDGAGGGEERDGEAEGDYERAGAVEEGRGVGSGSEEEGPEEHGGWYWRAVDGFSSGKERGG